MARDDAGHVLNVWFNRLNPMEHQIPELAIYILVQMAGLLLLVTAAKRPRLARKLLAGLFFAASMVNLYFGFSEPDIYLNYAPLSLPWYHDFILGWFSHYDHLIVPLIALGQFKLVVLMTLEGKWVKWACGGMIFFLLAITPLMIGSGFPFTLISAGAVLMVWVKGDKASLWRAAYKPARKQLYI